MKLYFKIVCFLDPCDAVASDENCCSSYRKCWLGEGDCDFDHDCYSGLVCGNNNCGPDFPAGFDCCEKGINVKYTL